MKIAKLKKEDELKKGDDLKNEDDHKKRRQPRHVDGFTNDEDLKNDDRLQK